MSRALASLLTAAVFALIATAADASISGWSRTPRAQAGEVAFAEPVLAPAAFPRFCSEYPEDCRAQRWRLRPTRLVAKADTWKTLVDTNARVNAAIRPAVLAETGTDAHW